MKYFTLFFLIITLISARIYSQVTEIQYNKHKNGKSEKIVNPPSFMKLVEGGTMIQPNGYFYNYNGVKQ